MTGGAPTTPLAEANTARAAAALMRAEWLVALDAGVVDADGLIDQACVPEGRPLLRLPLRQVLISQPHFGNARAGKTLARMQSILGVEMPIRDMTVAWLLDSRVGGRRFMAWLDATLKNRSEPASGFPYLSPFSAGDAGADALAQTGVRP
jgi:hypothetical protein